MNGYFLECSVYIYKNNPYATNFINIITKLQNKIKQHSIYKRHPHPDEQLRRQDNVEPRVQL